MSEKGEKEKGMCGKRPRWHTVLISCIGSSQSTALFQLFWSIWLEEFNKEKANELTRFPVFSSDESPLPYGYSSLIGIWKTASQSGNIEHDCASGSFASLLQDWPDPVVRWLIAIDTLLRKLNSRITFQTSGLVEDFFFFYAIVFSTMAFHPSGIRWYHQLSNRHIVGRDALFWCWYCALI